MLDIGAAAGGAALGVVNGVMDLAFGKQRQKQQLKGQKEALRQQNEAQYDMWLKTNYGAQKEQLEKAGLNPGLLYGMSGGGGATTGGASAMPTAQGGQAGMDIQGAMQLQLLKAQKENIEADTANKQAEATKKSGVDTELGYQQIETLRQSIRNAQAQEALTKVETGLKEIESTYQGETLENRIASVSTELSNMYQQLRIIQNQADISTVTKETAISQIKANYAMTLLQMEATKKGIQVSDVQMAKMGAEIVTMFKEAETGRWNAETNARNAGNNENRLRFDEKINNVAKDMQLTVDVVKGILQAIGLGGMMKGAFEKPRNPIGY